MVRLVPLPGERFDEARNLMDWSERAAELLDRTLQGRREARAIAALDRDAALEGVVVFGAIAGAVATGAILVVAVRHDARRRGIGRALVRRALDDLRSDGTRLVVAELAGSAENAPALRLLATCGFREEGAIADYYREGVPLLVLEHRFE